MAQIHYTKAFIEAIDKIHVHGYENIAAIASFPKEAGQQILREILETGCQSGNHANIELSRETIAKLPEDWLLENMPSVIEKYLFKELDWQEWEFRRMAEMLEEPFARCLRWLIDYAKQFDDPEVAKAIMEYME